MFNVSIGCNGNDPRSWAKCKLMGVVLAADEAGNKRLVVSIENKKPEKTSFELVVTNLITGDVLTADLKTQSLDSVRSTVMNINQHVQWMINNNHYRNADKQEASIKKIDNDNSEVVTPEKKFKLFKREVIKEEIIEDEEENEDENEKVSG